MGKSNAGKQKHHKTFNKRREQERKIRDNENRHEININVYKDKIKNKKYEDDPKLTQTWNEPNELETKINNSYFTNKKPEEISEQIKKIMQNKNYFPIGILEINNQLTITLSDKITKYLTITHKTIEQHLNEYKIKDLKELEDIINDTNTKPSVNNEKFSMLYLRKKDIYKLKADTYNNKRIIKYEIINENNQLKAKISFVGKQQDSYVKNSKGFYNRYKATINTETLTNITEALSNKTQVVHQNI